MTDKFIETVEDNFYVAILEGCIVGTGMINLESGKVDGYLSIPAICGLA